MRVLRPRDRRLFRSDSRPEAAMASLGESDTLIREKNAEEEVKVFFG
jgi:hypothetical protein